MTPFGYLLQQSGLEGLSHRCYFFICSAHPAVHPWLRSNDASSVGKNAKRQYNVLTTDHGMLQVVQHLLPLPFLRVGRLQAIDPSTRGTCRERWQTHVFVLDHQAFQSASTVQRHHYQVLAHAGPSTMSSAMAGQPSQPGTALAPERAQICPVGKVPMDAIRSG